MRVFTVLTVLFTLLAATAAQAEKRIALVIGNGKYAHTSPLTNPPNDARLMAATLRSLGFDVIEKVDADRGSILRAVRAFGTKLEGAGEEGVGLFYYAGHGVQVNAENYMIPVDARIENESDVEIDAITTNSVVGKMAFAGSGVNFVILDACRNNPFARSFRSATRGLAVMDAPRGTVIAYATAPGDVAADGGTANSPYTSSLVKVMQEPGLTALQMFQKTRQMVIQKTGDAQVPWEASSLTGDFYFVPQGSTVTVIPPGGSVGTDKEALFWETIKASTDPAEFEAYLDQYPDGTFAALARLRIKALKEAEIAALTLPPTPATEPQAELKPEPAVGVNPTLEPVETFKDCDICPEMVVIPPGSFRMGDLDGNGNDDEVPVHQVNIDYSFAVGKYEVTQAEYEAVMGTNPSVFKRQDRPVEKVSWDGAQDYLMRLSRKTGKKYRLLSEAEWEYMARAGSTSIYPHGNAEKDLCAYGNGADSSSRHEWRNKSCDDGFAKKTAPVGRYRPNGFGIHDTTGNVSEWVEDCWNGSYGGAPDDGKSWTSGDCSGRMFRGGSYIDDPKYLRVADRSNKYEPDYPSGLVGFRVARTLE